MTRLLITAFAAVLLTQAPTPQTSSAQSQSAQQPQAGQQPPSGQQPQRPPVFRGGTNQVRVDITVLNKKGEPVTNLTKDDFQVLEDGQPQ